MQFLPGSQAASVLLLLNNYLLWLLILHTRGRSIVLLRWSVILVALLRVTLLVTLWWLTVTVSNVSANSNVEWCSEK